MATQSNLDKFSKKKKTKTTKTKKAAKPKAANRPK